MVSIFNLTTTQEVPSLVTSSLSITSVQTAGAHFLVDAVHPFGIWHTVFGTGKLKLML